MNAVTSRLPARLRYRASSQHAMHRVSARQALRRRCCSQTAAEPPGKPDSDTVKKTVRELREAQVDRETAQEIMKLWKDNGITDDPGELQKLYQQRGGDAYARFGFQMFLDLCACFAAFQASKAISAGDDFFARPVVLFVFSAVTFNYALAFLSNLANVVISVRSMNRFGTNAAAYLEAIKEIAGASSIDAVEKVTRAIDSFKIASTLENMDKWLKEHADETGTVSTLENLSVYLTLDKARKRYDFREEDYGLSSDEAFNIARIFSKYDKNGDFRLDQFEFEALCADSGRELDTPEAKAALGAIDENDNGVIEFDEFVAFWTDPHAKVRKLSEAARAEAAEQKAAAAAAAEGSA